MKGKRCISCNIKQSAAKHKVCYSERSNPQRALFDKWVTHKFAAPRALKKPSWMLQKI